MRHISSNKKQLQSCMCRVLNTDENHNIFYHKIGNSEIECLESNVFSGSKDFINRFQPGLFFSDTTYSKKTGKNTFVIIRELEIGGS